MESSQGSHSGEGDLLSGVEVKMECMNCNKSCECKSICSECGTVFQKNWETSIVKSQQTVESHPSKYRRLANSQADALPRAAEPYFPVGLAVSADEPLSFNFDLFLYDGLELPAGLFGDDAGGSVSFGNVQEAREYCERYARHARQVVVEPSAEPSARRGRLDKRAMFAESGNSLRELMETGNSACDQNLDRVRRDSPSLSKSLTRLKLRTKFHIPAAAPTDEQDRQPGEEQDCDSAQRDATRAASQKSASGGAARSSNSGPTASSSDQQPEQPMAADGTRPVPDPAVPSEEILRQRLLQIPRVDTIHVPKASTLVSLRDFLSKHVPLGPHEIEERSRGLLPVINEVTAASTAKGQDHRRFLQEMWNMAKGACTCLAADPDRGGTPCPYKSSDRDGKPIDPAGTAACGAVDSCNLCAFFAQVALEWSTGACLNKAGRFRLLVSATPYLVRMVRSDAISTSDEQQRFKRILEKLLFCRTDQLNAMLSVGDLVLVVPRITQVHLTSGWSLFWREMRKFGCALQWQPTRTARIAVLQFLRLTCLSRRSPWAYYLTADGESAETWQALLGSQDDGS